MSIKSMKRDCLYRYTNFEMNFQFICEDVKIDVVPHIAKLMGILTTRGKICLQLRCLRLRCLRLRSGGGAPGRDG